MGKTEIFKIYLAFDRLVGYSWKCVIESCERLEIEGKEIKIENKPLTSKGLKIKVRREHLVAGVRGDLQEKHDTKIEFYLTVKDTVYDILSMNFL